MNQVIKQGVRLISGILMVMAFVIVVVAWRMNYESFISWVEQSLSKKGWTEFFRSAMPEERFYISRWVITGLCAVGMIVLLFLFRQPESTARTLNEFLLKSLGLFKSFRLNFLHQKRPIKIILIIIFTAVILRSLWHISTLPLQYDEMWTANYFIHGPIWKSILIPGNNHIFYTVVADIFTTLPVDDSIAIRLPALLAGLLTLVLFWTITLKLAGDRAAIAGVTFLGSSIMFTMYSVLARSYSFILFFTLLMIWSVLRMKEEPKNKYFHHIYFLTLFFGYWSNPLFIYGHICLLAVVLIFAIKNQNFQLWKSMLRISLVVSCVESLLYLPTIFAGHAGAIVDAGVLNTNTDIWAVIMKVNHFLPASQLGFGQAGWVYVPMLIFAIAVSRKNRDLFFLTVGGFISFVLIVLFSCLQQKILSDHVVIFFTVFTSFAVASVTLWLQNFWRYVYIPVTVIIFIVNSFFAHGINFLYWSRENDMAAKKISRYLLQNEVTGVYLQWSYIKPALEYYYRQESKQIQISMASPESKDYKPFVSSDKYPAIITEKGKGFDELNSSYKIVFSTAQSDLWMLRD